jgi:hypothetical protein
VAVLAFTNLLLAWAAVGQVQRQALIGDVDVEVEFVELTVNGHRPLRCAAILDGFDCLGDAKGRPAHDVRPGVSAPATAWPNRNKAFSSSAVIVPMTSDDPTRPGKNAGGNLLK